MIIEILLLDRTTGKNILWANSEHGAKEIQRDDVYSIVTCAAVVYFVTLTLKPRFIK